MSDENDLESKHATLVHADPESVYEAFTIAEGLDACFTEGSYVNPSPGGEIRFRWKNWGPDLVSGEDGGPVLEADRSQRFVFQWHPDDESYATTVEVDFRPTGEGTVVRLREYGYKDTPASRRCQLDCAAGWGEALTLLKFYVEHGSRY